ncbi:MAG: antitoxin Xre-like helix-turn-helix domain-containing protein [Ginsengibacter sp.]
MKKKIKKYNLDTPPTTVEEPLVAYGSPKKMYITKDFTYNDFKKVNSKTDFTQKEWSDILHISERTLQRYAKDNSSFSFSVTDRILQIDKVIERGLEVFGSYEKFLLWIRDNPYMLEGRLSLQSLASFEGITNVLAQLGRIEHGIFA